MVNFAGNENLMDRKSIISEVLSDCKHQGRFAIKILFCYYEFPDNCVTFFNFEKLKGFYYDVTQKTSVWWRILNKILHS